MANILVIRVRETWFGIETFYVKAITKNTGWLNNKSPANFTNGITAYNGQNISLAGFPDESKNCLTADLVIVSFNGNKYLLQVDEIIDIFQVDEKDILPFPAFAKKHMSKYFFKGVFCIDSKLVLLLDVSKFSAYFSS
ncbi:MAG: chemotaxis protein CheW [Candidatus Loosdrechtia sp.]|uniref:chemotaxis protein CheW n=1 Tax=Candidatus Loosdrechtia sp. TaxID=3101272 RepID=UPI003A74704B|nr:MAG: chemotaxis protein CheW [Candidatus Jettenia sp. AMX2]